MCFSATASFTAAGVLATIGCLSLKAAHSRQLRFLAAIPLLFAIQQILEGITWVTFNTGHIEGILHYIGIYGFLFFAGVFWPAWVPLTLSKFEHDPFRKKIFKLNLGIGLFLALSSSLLMLVIGQDAEMISKHISYPLFSHSFDPYIGTDTGFEYYSLLTLYVWVVVGSCFVSSLPYIWIFGLLTGVGFIITELFYSYAFESIWCYFAALISAFILLIIKKLAKSGY